MKLKMRWPDGRVEEREVEVLGDYYEVKGGALAGPFSFADKLAAAGCTELVGDVDKTSMSWGEVDWYINGK